jgi:hypothetical protein
MKKLIENYRHFEAEGLTIGRMVSASKSSYRERYPDHEVCFNANVFSAQQGKIWYGDLDITLDGEKLDRIAESLGEKLFVLREMDGRFENESLSEIKVMQKAIYTTK